VLRAGADQIRTQWVTARVEAMRSDQTYVFRYTPQGNRYCVSCQALPEGSADTQLASGNAAAQNSGSAQPAASGQTVEGTLPEGITFAGSETVSDLRAALAADQGGGSNQASAGLSEPIFFYPDGTASAARLLLQNERGRGILLSLRGLTGVVTVGDVQAVDGQAAR